MLNKIEINIIPHDLRHEETIVRIADTLDRLDSAVTYIFNCINSRLSENTQRLSIIKDRAKNLEGRLNYLQTNLNLKAVKMYSAAKYPAAHTYKEYQRTILHKQASLETLPNTYKCSVPIESMPDVYLSSNTKTEDGQYVANTNLQEKLQFYHVRSKQSENQASNKEGRDFFLQLSSISSLLLYDSMDNPYEKKLNKPLSESEDKKQIEDAPDSIIQPWNSLEAERAYNYLYTPILGEVPRIDVPLTLPDLPGIVDDEKFKLDLSSQNPIAPSSTVTTPTVHLDLPTPIGNEIMDTIGHNSLDLPVVMGNSDGEVENLPPPPPPPPPPPSDPPTVDITEMTVPQKRVEPFQPPPPAPPPPPIPIEPAEQSEKTVKAPLSGTHVHSNVDDSRSSLMAAIRNAGGIGRAKLRNTALTDKKRDRFSSATVGDDLMDDLHAKLAARRRGIAGDSTLARMSKLIPPPQTNESALSDRNSATSECDSLPDTDDWDE
ncbi:WASH complex subunit 1-like [Prorops nasuta]|uniref:WASH complex subunit 1-like n=1 Tax=Prorops nasuta TaxID=863751 RepID=UPI0034CD11EC